MGLNIILNGKRNYVDLDEILENKDMNIKILVINHAFVLDINRRVFKQLSTFKNICVTLLASQYWILRELNKIDWFENVNISDLNYKVEKGYGLFLWHPSLYFFPFKLISLLIREQLDIVLVQEDIYSFISFLVTLLKYVFGYKVVIDSWQNIHKHYIFPFNLMQKFVLKSADRINAGGKEIEKVLRLKGYKEQVDIMPLAYDENLFFTRECNESLKNYLKLKGIIIGYLGRLIKEKGVQFLIKALLNCDFEYTLIIDDIGGDYREEIYKLVVEQGISDNVRYITPSHYEIVNYYRCLDILVLPTYTTDRIKEQFGRVLVEAMACGVNVIGSDSGEITYIIGEAGLIFKQKNVNDLSDKINKLVYNKDLRNKLRKLGIKRVQDKYSTEAVAKLYYNQITKLISK